VMFGDCWFWMSMGGAMCPVLRGGAGHELRDTGATCWK